MDEIHRANAVAALACMSFCVLAQAQAPPLGRVRVPVDQRLPSEPPPPYASQWGSAGSSVGQFLEPVDLALAQPVVPGELRPPEGQRLLTAQDPLERLRAEGERRATSDSQTAADQRSPAAHLSTADQRTPGEPPPPFAAQWGSNGSGPGQFHDPVDVSVDTAGNVYVVDRSNHRIQKFDSNGTFLLTWGWGVLDGSSALQTCTSACQEGLPGSGDGQLSNPWGVVADLSGNVYVADYDNHRIQKFDGNGAYLLKWGTNGTAEGQFVNPIGVGVDYAGNVYVAEYGNHRVQKFDETANFQRAWGWGVDDGSSAFQVCTSGCEAGLPGAGDGQFGEPTGVVIDLSGTVFVTDLLNDRVQQFDSNGAYLGKWGSCGAGDGQLIDPLGLAVDVAGKIYVADSFNNRIQKFDRTSQYNSQWGSIGTGAGQFWLPLDVAVDASGNVYVADTFNDRIQKFGPAYETVVLLDQWGALGSGDGQFKDAYDVTIDSSGNVYAVELTNYRVQKFDSAGNFLRMWGWGVDDGSAAFQVCTSNCQSGLPGAGNGQFQDATSLAVDASGNVYVAESWSNRVQKFASDGTFLDIWDSGVAGGGGDGQLLRPMDVAIGPLGSLYVVDRDNYRVQVLDGAGNLVRMSGWGVLDGSNELQVCTSGCQAGISGNGDGQLNWPVGIAIDASGDVYIGDDGAHRMVKFDGSGNFLHTWGWGVQDGSNELQVCTSGCQIGLAGSGDGQFHDDSLAGIAIDTSGNLNVSDWGNDRIQRFSSDGVFITKWGLYGTGDGELFRPQGGEADVSGNVLFADRLNHRIQKFGPCTFGMTPGNQLFSAAGGVGSFSLDAISEACSWSLTPSQPWITVSSQPAGIGDGTVDFSVAANPTAYSRGGILTFTDETTKGPGAAFVVIQDPAPCTYGLSPGSASFAGGAGVDHLTVNSLLGCAWTAVSNDGWIGVTAGGSGNGSGIVLYSVAANPGSAARSGTMTIAGQTFTVNQDPQVPAAPSNLAAAAVNSTKVQLSWDDNAGNEAWIRVERKLGDGGTLAQINTLPPNTTGTQDTTVEKNTTYFYRVMACNSAGCSAPSAEVSVTTPAYTVFVGEEDDRPER